MKYLLGISIIIIGLQTKAQQEPMYTHYSFNTLSINPAYAGSRNVLSATTLTRFQWVNFDGAPITQTIQIHTPLRNNKAGLGLSFVNDRIGPTNTTSIFGDLAIKIKMGEKGKFAFGFRGGIRIRNNNLQDLELVQSVDPKFQNNAVNEILPNIGFGLYYSNPKFYLGIGVPYLLRSSYDANFIGTNNLAYQENHAFFIAGGIFNLTKTGTVKLKPTTFLKLARGAKPQLDITSLFYFNDKVWAGPMFRTGDSFGLLIGLSLTDQFSFGYSFDWSYGVNTGRYNSGGHEVMLRYDFIFKSKGKIVSPSYF
ncbi:type IX secretion system membrane protein PorP/SprF [Crocinitomix catalasitica]|nr:type IX secretion system membrane protein PorP/SprF [Crocinitomix catalasitica]